MNLVLCITAGFENIRLKVEHDLTYISYEMVQFQKYVYIRHQLQITQFYYHKFKFHSFYLNYDVCNAFYWHLVLQTRPTSRKLVKRLKVVAIVIKSKKDT